METLRAPLQRRYCCVLKKSKSVELEKYAEKIDFHINLQPWTDQQTLQKSKFFIYNIVHSQ